MTSLFWFRVILVLELINQGEVAAFTSLTLRASPSPSPELSHQNYRSFFQFQAESTKASIKQTRAASPSNFLLRLSADPSKIPENTSGKNNEDNYRSSSATSSVASQAALIAGTTIGGGFLALPTATAPCGAAPAAVGLIGVWLYLLAGALSLSNAIFMMKSSEGELSSSETPTSTSVERSRQDDDDDVPMFSLIRECFGSTAGILGGLLFLLLVKVTLIAQLSKVGVILEGVLPMMDRRVWTALFSMAITILCLVGKQRKIERINDVLTTTMLISFATLVSLAGVSGWSLDGLMRADYKSLLPSFSSSATNNHGGGPWAIPIFIQLLLYNEVVPLVSSRLGDEQKVRQAILFGSSVPLIMCLVWSCVALGLVPYDPSIMTAGVIYDPLTNLGDAVLSKGGSIGKIFLASVNVLAGSAICTTVIGSVLASTQYFDDVIISLTGYVRRNDGKDDGTVNSVCNDTTHADRVHEVNMHNNTKQTMMLPKYRKLITYSLAVVPSAIVALSGSSDLYFRATSFAGEFPCTLLYGLIPPLCNLRLLWKHSKNNKEAIIDWKHVAMQVVLAMISIVILVVSNVLK